MREAKLKIPIEIDDDTKDLIERSYFNAVKEIGDYEIVYIKNKINKKISSVKKNNLSWVVDLANFYKELFNILIENEKKFMTISAGSFKSIATALFYFINPYDIIPDDTLDVGYADDYYVMIVCINSMCEEDRDIILDRLEKVK